MSNRSVIHCVDDELNRDLLRDILSEYELVLLHSGQDCLDMAPDLFLVSQSLFQTESQLTAIIPPHFLSK